MRRACHSVKATKTIHRSHVHQLDRQTWWARAQRALGPGESMSQECVLVGNEVVNAAHLLSASSVPNWWSHVHDARSAGPRGDRMLACAPGLCLVTRDFGRYLYTAEHHRNFACNRFFAARAACGAAGDARTRAVPVAASSMECHFIRYGSCEEREQSVGAARSWFASRLLRQIAHLWRQERKE